MLFNPSKLGLMPGSMCPHLLGLVADCMPDAVQLTPYNIIKAFEQALLQGQLTGVYLVGLSQLLNAGVHQVRYSVINGTHVRAEV